MFITSNDDTNKTNPVSQPQSRTESRLSGFSKRLSSSSSSSSSSPITQRSQKTKSLNLKRNFFVLLEKKTTQSVTAEEKTALLSPKSEGEKDVALDSWRIEKYTKIMEQIVDASTNMISEDQELTNYTKHLLTEDDSKLNECERHTKKALNDLSGTGRNDAREDHKHFKEAFREALNSDEYKNHANDEPPPPFVKLLHTIAYCEFTKANVQSFTKEVAIKTAESPSLSRSKRLTNPLGVAKTVSKTTEEMKGSQPLEFFDTQIKHLGEFHLAVSDTTGEHLGQKIKGESTLFNFDPATQGNPPNIKFIVQNQNGDVINVRTPTPTDEKGNINPEFKAFLRYLKSKGQKYTMINLQDRRHLEVKTGSLLKQTADKAIGREGEYSRARALEALSEEFKDTITVFTLDKNSPFFKQEPSKEMLENGIQALKDNGISVKDLEIQIKKEHHGEEPKGSDLSNPEWKSVSTQILELGKEIKDDRISALKQDKALFIKDFKTNLFEDKESGFHIPEEWKKEGNPNRQKIIERLELVSTTLFSEKTALSPEEKQDFIEIAYIFLADLFVSETGASCYNESCKDCIDRGGGANWTILAFMTLMEVAKSGGNLTPELKERVESLPARMQEDALWARKRPIIGERLFRARSAILRVSEAIQKDPSIVEKFDAALGFKKITG
jgi:hypothetical protein